MRLLTLVPIILATMFSHAVIGQEATKKKSQELAAVKEKIEIRTDVEYAKDGEHSLKLDVYRPKASSDQPRPCIVWIHGGGWLKGDKSSGLARLGKWVATGDYVGVSVGYRLTDKGTWPIQIHDCKAAIRYLRSHAAELGIQPDRIAVWGSSAGGHLVSLLGTSGDVAELEGNLGVTGVSSRVACVVDYCGPSDFLRFAKDAPRLNEPVYKLLGGSVKDKRDLAKQASPVTYVSKDDPPFLIVHGTADRLVPIDQAITFHEAQVKAGMKSEYIKMEGGGHGIGGDEIEKRVKAFLDRELLGRQVTVDTTAIIVH
jgi:acetyl esterase/lipase